MKLKQPFLNIIILGKYVNNKFGPAQRSKQADHSYSHDCSLDYVLCCCAFLISATTEA